LFVFRGKSKKLNAEHAHIQTGIEIGEKKTSINDAEIQTFTKLGLTFVQSKVYLALVKSGFAAIKTISKMAQLDRSEVYRGISELQKIGLVEKAIIRPSIYKCVSMNDGLLILLERKTKEFHEIRAQTTELIRKSREHQINQSLQFEDSQFVIVPEREVALRRWMKATEGAQKSLDFIIRWKGFISGLQERSEHFKSMLERGVKIRGIVAEPESQKSVAAMIMELEKKGSYRLRYMLMLPEAVFSIIDSKEVLFNVVPMSIPTQTSSLWSNNPSLAAVVQDYFELKWNLLTPKGKNLFTSNKQEIVSC
jgi:sugar-specific transcriptional regulator TrmB